LSRRNLSSRRLASQETTVFSTAISLFFSLWVHQKINLTKNSGCWIQRNHNELIISRGARRGRQQASIRNAHVGNRPRISAPSHRIRYIDLFPVGGGSCNKLLAAAVCNAAESVRCAHLNGRYAAKSDCNVSASTCGLL